MSSDVCVTMEENIPVQNFNTSHTPQQNELAKRLNRRVMERCLMFETEFNKQLRRE